MPKKKETEVPKKKNKKELITFKRAANKGLTICCVYKTGGDFTVDYVQRLYRSLLRNLSMPFHFVVLTDSKEDIPEANKIVKLKHNWKGFWSKLELFRPGLFGPEDQVIYFDLDTVICASIDCMVGCKLKFKMMESFRNQNNPASGIMMWEGDWSAVYEHFKTNTDRFKRIHKGDQEYIKYALKITKAHSPGKINELVEILSFKRHCTDLGPPKGSPIVCFHGKPRPHTVFEDRRRNKWMLTHWV